MPSNRLSTWHESYELIFSELCDEAQIRGYLHKKAYEHYYSKNLWFQIPIMMFSAISGSGNFISNSFPEQQKYIILAVGALSIITGIISSVFQYMKVSELAEGHRLSYLSWEKFYTNIKFQLRRKDDDRDNILEFINMIIPEYQRLIEISPDIPSHITSIIKKKKKEMDWIHLPFIISDFDKTTPYANRFDELKRRGSKSVPSDASSDKSLDKLSDKSSDKSSDIADSTLKYRRRNPPSESAPTPTDKNGFNISMPTTYVPQSISQHTPLVKPPSTEDAVKLAASISNNISQIPNIIHQTINSNNIPPNTQLVAPPIVPPTSTETTNQLLQKLLQQLNPQSLQKLQQTTTQVTEEIKQTVAEIPKQIEETITTVQNTTIPSVNEFTRVVMDLPENITSIDQLPPDIQQRIVSQIIGNNQDFFIPIPTENSDV